MTAIGAQNPFAPPNALVEDHLEHSVEMVDATRMSRFLAYLVDASPLLVLGIVGGVLAAAAPFLLGKGGFAIVLGVAGAAVIAWAVWNITLLYRFGQTIGKKVLGIRIVRTDGSRMSFARLFFLRVLPLGVVAGVVSAVAGPRHPFYSYAVMWIDCLLIFRASRLCLHDTIADTKVVTAASSPMATLEGSRGTHLRTISF